VNKTHTILKKGVKRSEAAYVIRKYPVYPVNFLLAAVFLAIWGKTHCSKISKRRKPVSAFGSVGKKAGNKTNERRTT